MELDGKTQTLESQAAQQNIKQRPPSNCKRAQEDWLSMPIFIVWSAIISVFIEASTTNENINDFFVNVLGEGIALKSIPTLFVIALLPAGLALVRPLTPGGAWEQIFCAPARLGRGMSITTLAFMLGTLPAYWWSAGFDAAMKGLAVPLLGSLLMWVVLFVQHFLIVNANTLINGSHATFFRVLGKVLIAGCVAGSVLLYFQILDGDYKSEPAPVETPAVASPPAT